MHQERITRSGRSRLWSDCKLGGAAGVRKWINWAGGRSCSLCWRQERCMWGPCVSPCTGRNGMAASWRLGEPRLNEPALAQAASTGSAAVDEIQRAWVNEGSDLLDFVKTCRAGNAAAGLPAHHAELLCHHGHHLHLLPHFNASNAPRTCSEPHRRHECPSLTCRPQPDIPGVPSYDPTLVHCRPCCLNPKPYSLTLLPKT